jgi:hypothetical protein
MERAFEASDVFEVMKALGLMVFLFNLVQRSF